MIPTITAFDSPRQSAELVGAWKLICASSTDDLGQRDDAPFGQDATGSLIYTDDGRISVMVSHGGRQLLSNEDLSIATPAERAEAFRTFNAYAGRYTLAGDRITHHVEIASLPNWVGRELVRMVRCKDDRLTLETPPHPVEGSPRSFTLVWQRL